MHDQRAGGPPDSKLSGFRLSSSPAALLLANGLLLGLMFPLGKLAVEARISPVVWSWVIAAGSASVLWVIRAVATRTVVLKRTHARYYLLLSLCALVLPNILIYTVIPRLGSGFTGILFTLSPIFTLTLSSLWQVRLPSRLGVLGILVGFAGAMIVAISRGEAGTPATLLWVLVGLCIPASLAVGNVYRTLAWPDKAPGIDLAIGCNVMAALVLLAIGLVSPGASGFVALLQHKPLVLVQVLVGAAMFSLFFRLQAVGGPTYLSQMGYIAAAVALVAGTVFLQERYALITWLGAGVVVVGIGLSVLAQRPASTT